jgi:hypothetical protein
MKPRHAHLLRLFDYFAALTFGVASATAAGYAIPNAWPMPLAMVAGMALGMLAAFPVLMIFGLVLGGFEILMMSMQIGMPAGMAGVMAGSESPGILLLTGAAAGGGVQFLLHMMDLRLRGERLPESYAEHE